MRTFEERKAEIFRRSEERITARKRAVKIGAGCVTTLLLCLSLLSLFPQSGEDGSGTPEQGNMEQYVDGSGQQIPADSKALSHLLSKIMDKTTTDGYGEEVSPDAMEQKPVPDATPNGEVQAQVYTFVTENRTYTLANRILTDCETKQEYLLTAQEYEELKAALGITQ